MVSTRLPIIPVVDFLIVPLLALNFSSGKPPTLTAQIAVVSPKTDGEYRSQGQKDILYRDEEDMDIIRGFDTTGARSWSCGRSEAPIRYSGNSLYSDDGVWKGMAGVTASQRDMGDPDLVLEIYCSLQKLYQRRKLSRCFWRMGFITRAISIWKRYLRSYRRLVDDYQVVGVKGQYLRLNCFGEEKMFRSLHLKFIRIPRFVFLARGAINPTTALGW